MGQILHLFEIGSASPAAFEDALHGRARDFEDAV